MIVLSIIQTYRGYTMKYMRYLVAGALPACILILIMSFAAQADEVRYPVPCYEGEELAKVREWEKNWVGKRITKENIDGVKEFIPETFYSVFTNPDWGGDYWFEIEPYRQMVPAKGDIALTTKYAGTCTVDDNDNMLNYIGGIPFPHPKKGIEIAYNFDNRNWGDQYSALQDVWIIDGKRKYDRKMILMGHCLIFSGRRDIPPVPELDPNPKGTYWGMHSEYLEPASYKGTRAMSMTWKDRSRDWASWSFSSATRRITRRSTAQRQSHSGGTDTTYDDSLFWSWAVSCLNVKILGRKELLLPRHSNREKILAGHREGYCLFNGGEKERINTWVLEIIHKDPGYIYSKQIWYVDPEMWWIMYTDKYDKRGKLWKAMEMYMDTYVSKYNGAIIPMSTLPLVVDLERMHATATRSVIELGITGNKEQDIKYYEPRALMRYGY